MVWEVKGRFGAHLVLSVVISAGLESLRRHRLKRQNMNEQ